jgi:hypothetical protein
MHAERHCASFLMARSGADCADEAGGIHRMAGNRQTEMTRHAPRMRRRELSGSDRRGMQGMVQDPLSRLKW